VVNIGIEGMMLAGALAAWAVDAWLGRAAGIVAAVLAAWALALPFALATLRFAADQIVTGTGINLLALGITGMIYRLLPDSFGDRVAGIDQRWLVIAAPILGALVWAFFRFTRAGLELGAIGEAPQAADTAGVPVWRRKFYAILFGSACAGIAGAYLSVMRDRTFTENMTDGVGFLALAMVIFGRWHAGGIVAAGLFFGLVRALANHLQTRTGIGVPGFASTIELSAGAAATDSDAPLRRQPPRHRRRRWKIRSAGGSWAGVREGGVTAPPETRSSKLEVRMNLERFELRISNSLRTSRFELRAFSDRPARASVIFSPSLSPPHPSCTIIPELSTGRARFRDCRTQEPTPLSSNREDAHGKQGRRKFLRTRTPTEAREAAGAARGPVRKTGNRRRAAGADPRTLRCVDGARQWAGGQRGWARRAQARHGEAQLPDAAR
jgi:simple sugar transport system permease protein